MADNTNPNPDVPGEGTPAQTQRSSEQNDDLKAQLAHLKADVEAGKAALAAATAKPTPKRRQVEPPKTSNDPKEQMAELQRFANEQAREAELLRTAIDYGLTPDELSDLEYNNPTELKLAAQLKAQQKEQQRLADTLSKAEAKLLELGKQPAQRPDEREDSGGRTARVAKITNKAKELRDQAQEKGRTHEGRLLILESIRRDPTKVLTIVETDDEE